MNILNLQEMILKKQQTKLQQTVLWLMNLLQGSSGQEELTGIYLLKIKSDILLHAHCQQKAIASSASTIEMLSIPVNYTVKEIPSGCCGMAGSFGYEKEHFELSNKIGELVLFPEIRKSDTETIIAAPGTSCRHHIKDGTGRVALHPAVVLYNALKKDERLRD